MHLFVASYCARTLTTKRNSLGPTRVHKCFLFSTHGKCKQDHQCSYECFVMETFGYVRHNLELHELPKMGDHMVHKIDRNNHVHMHENGGGYD